MKRTTKKPKKKNGIYCRSGKTAFKTADDAMLRGVEVGLYHYHCPECHRFHLTSLPQLEVV